MACSEGQFRDYLSVRNGADGRFMTGLAIAYHGDGKTYGYWPGEFGNRLHIHLFYVLPADSEL